MAAHAEALTRQVLPRHRVWPRPVAPAQSPCELHGREVVTADVDVRNASRLPAVPATLRASPEPNSAALRTVEEQDVFSLRFWLPASIHHPWPPPQPLAPLRYGQGSEHFSSSSRCAPTKTARPKGCPVVPVR